MGTYKEDEYASDQGPKKSFKTFIACVWSFLVSMAGGLILGYWEYKYHLTSSQLWMVPLGLILFITPVIVWFSLIVSEICNSMEEKEEEDGVGALDGSVDDDADRYLKV